MRRLVIIPTYNERENIAKMIDAIMELDEEYDLLIIDDASPDGTAEIVRERMPNCVLIDGVHRLHLIERSGKLGLGTAYIEGFRWALKRKYNYIFQMDCDFSHDPDDILRLIIPAIHINADVVIGSRYVMTGKVVNWPLSRRLISRCASIFVKMVTWTPVCDATSGFVCYRREALASYDFDKIQMKGYGFQIEMKHIARKRGMHICEIPIVFTERRSGASKMTGGIFGEAFWGVLKLPFRKFGPVVRMTHNYN